MVDSRRNERAKEQAVSLEPYIWLFQSGDNHYVLDHHTNRIFSLTPREAECLGLWREGRDWDSLRGDFSAEMGEIQKLGDQGCFSCSPPSGLAFGSDWNEIETMIRRQRFHTVIEITQQCNLRCKYCTFGGGFVDHRIHGSQSMPPEVLFKAINAAIEHSADLKEISLGFYGGEPLLEFKLLKEAVEFAKRYSGGKPVRFSLTTNATLIDREIAGFLQKNKFNILVSIDGPEQLHDRYRVFSNGEGSYHSTIRGLKTLLEIYPEDMYDLIGLNMVIPSIGWINEVHALWNEEKWLPRGIRAQTSVVDPPSGFVLLPDPSDVQWDDLQKNWLESKNNKTNRPWAIYSNLFDRHFAIIHQRQTFPGFRSDFFPNGCCIPAVRKVYVTVDGDYHICERAHGCPPVGNLESGVDVELIKKMVDEYCIHSMTDCCNCIAVANCSLCFNHAFENGQYRHERKKVFCESERMAFARSVADYCRLVAEQPQYIYELEKVKLI